MATMMETEIETLNSLNDIFKHDDIQKTLNKFGIKTYYMYDEGVAKYATLYVDRFKANYESKLVLYSHGTVLDLINKKIIFIGCPPLNPNFKDENVYELVRSGLYHQTPIMDGTSINLYYYEDEWRIATFRCVNIGPMSIGNGITYKSAFEECMNKLNIGYEDLNKNMVYSLTLRHPELHIFPLSRYGYSDYQLLHIRSMNISKFRETQNIGDLEVMYDEYEGLPFKNFSTLSQMSVEDINVNVGQSLVNFLGGSQPNFGMILRQRCPTTGRVLDPTFWEGDMSYAHIIYESPLKAIIRTMVDSYEINKAIKSNNYNKKEYISLLACFNADYHKNFIKIFPNLVESHVLRCREYFKRITDNICEYIIFMSKRSDQITNISEKFSQTERAIISHILCTIKIKDREPKDIKSLVLSFIFNRDFIDRYYQDIFRNNSMNS